MRELHVVALSSDGKHLVVTPTKGSLRGAYLLPVNARLRKALNGELNPKPTPAPEPEAEQPPPKPKAESRLTPREIQARLRAGQAPEKVARAAGVAVDRVTRFYGPVLAERSIVLDAAREQGTVTRARLGASKAPLGPAVAANLAAKGLPAPQQDDWTAYRKPDGTWVVCLTVEQRGKARRAEWTWQPAEKAVTALDAYAAALGHVDKPVAKPRRPKR